MALTEFELKALTGNEKKRWLSDGHSLMGRMRVTKKGITVSFELRYKTERGTTTSLSCGSWPKVSLADIRKRSRELRKLIQSGTTPRQQRADAALRRQAERAEDQRILAEDAARLERDRLASMTVRDLYDAWLPTVSVKRGKFGRKDGGAEIKRTFEKFMLPCIGSTPLANVYASNVTPILTGISDAGKNRQATALLTDLQQMFRWGDSNQPFKRLLVECDVLAIKPGRVVSGSYDPSRDNERTRVLSEAEIRRVAQLLPSSGLSKAIQAALWVMLSCGTRVGETVAARWEHVDLENGTWSIPADHAKSATALAVQFSNFSLAQFAALRAAGEALPADKRSEWVFPSRIDRNRPLDNQTIGKALADRQRAAGESIKGRTSASTALVLADGQWKCHDLRRTAATLMQSLGVAESIVHRCLNHARSEKLDRVYLQHDYSPEMRAAWALLGERLELLVRQDAPNVVTLRSA
ncbi:phage integrase family protein [Caballeronia choica]|uniref:Phage integrase family protein n=1 Tax=Caballeronia choica TaxID=326476 RepID=A0A158KH00_9BURK|nr:site-specific integrase [Caballeronia choica]SAL79711.1 phage integrase family protein [Caballeronia choica]